MIKIIITENREKKIYEFHTEKELLDFTEELILTSIEVEKEYLEDMDGEAPDKEDVLERIKELKDLDKNYLYELENKAQLILGEYAEVEIVEFSFYVTDIFDKLGLPYDKSTMSNSIYVENQDDLLIRISDHKSSMMSHDYGHQIPQVNLIYRDGVVSNQDINKYFNTNLEYEIILL